MTPSTAIATGRPARAESVSLAGPAPVPTSIRSMVHREDKWVDTELKDVKISRTGPKDQVLVGECTV